ncbi:MAG: hypothetical protein K8F91_03985, partial [Candidatus Obscuribacterales bacterium]|nr:hypothetical protein [Candidatus Obscuribacterales bacterium]
MSREVAKLDEAIETISGPPVFIILGAPEPDPNAKFLPYISPASIDHEPYQEMTGTQIEKSLGLNDSLLKKVLEKLSADSEGIDFSRLSVGEPDESLDAYKDIRIAIFSRNKGGGLFQVDEIVSGKVAGGGGFSSMGRPLDDDRGIAKTAVKETIENIAKKNILDFMEKSRRATSLVGEHDIEDMESSLERCNSLLRLVPIASIKYVIPMIRVDTGSKQKRIFPLGIP